MLNSAGLIKGVNDAIVMAGASLNIASKFTADFSDAFAGEGLTAKVAVFKGGTASEFNPSTNNYGKVDDNDDGWATIALNKHPKFTRSLPQGVFLEQPNNVYWTKMAEACGKTVAKSISDAIAGVITADACTGTQIVCASGSLANVGAIRNSCASSIADTVIVLNGAYFTELLVALGGTYGASAEALKGQVVDGLFGFKAVASIEGLASGFVGAAIPANALAIAGRAVQIQNPENYAEYGTVTDPASGLTLTVRRHGDANSDATLINVEALFGASVVAGEKIQLIKAA
jgi:hypothetical protein